MKNIFKIALLCIFFVFTRIFTVGSSITQKTDSLCNIQNIIYESFLSSLQTNDLRNLEDIELRLKSESQNMVVDYWISYVKYYKSLYYIKIGNRPESGKEISEAITTIDTLTDKNSEIHALLAFLQSFSMQFPSANSSMEISSKVKSNAEMAVALDSMNVRAWYVLGTYDFYLPQAFGGGKKCEEYFLKAVSLPEQTTYNCIMPHWGKKDAYSSLVSYYIDREYFNDAKKYLDEALSLYPDDYMLNKYRNESKNKN